MRYYYSHVGLQSAVVTPGVFTGEITLSDTKQIGIKIWRDTEDSSTYKCVWKHEEIHIPETNIKGAKVSQQEEMKKPVPAKMS